MLTFYTANEILKHLVCISNSVNLSNAVYVGLSTTAPNRNGENVTEPNGNGYARVLLGNYAQSLSQLMNQPANGEVKNKQIIYFPEATGSWGTITHFCIFSAQTGGNLLAYGELTTPITPSANTIPIVRVNELVLSLS